MAENGPAADGKVVIIAVDKSKQAEYAVNCKYISFAFPLKSAEKRFMHSDIYV